MAIKKYVSLSKLSLFLDNLNATFSAKNHSHTVSDVTNLQTALDDKAPKDEATQSTSGLMSAEDKIQLDNGGIPIVTTSGDGATYTATVDGMTALTLGMKVTIIPHTVSTTTAPKLNVNGLGAKTIRMPVTYNTSLTSAGVVAGWLLANKPVTLQWNGTYWITVDLARTSAQYLSGAVPVGNGGTGLTEVTAGNFLVGNGTENMVEKTPAEVLELINGANVKTMTVSEYNALGSNINTNTLYALTDSEEEYASLDDLEILQAEVENTVKITPQTLTDAQKIQARENIDAVSNTDLDRFVSEEFVEEYAAPKAHAATHYAGGDDPLTPADIGALPLDGSKPMTGTLMLERSSPRVLLHNTNHERWAQLNLTNNGHLNLYNLDQDPINAGLNNYAAISIREGDGSASDAFRVASCKNGVVNSYIMLHTGNVTAGTTDITAGTTALGTGCYYDVYE